MPDIKKPVILVIDDEPIIRKTFKRYLDTFAYHTITAASGREGLESCYAQEVDLILVDLRMQDVDGLEVLAEVKAYNENIPVIVISATENVRDVAEALRCGAWDYLQKPIVEKSILLHAIEKGLERARLKRQNLNYQQQLELKIECKTKELALVNKRLKDVVESTKRLLGCGELQESGKVILEEFGNHMNAEGGSIYRVSEEGLHLIHSLDPGHAADFLPFPLREGSPFAKALNSKDPFYVLDITSSTGLDTSGWTKYTDDSILFFPIIDRRHRTLAIIALHNKQKPPFLTQDREIGAILASYAGEILQTAQVESELRKSEGYLLQSQKMEAIGTLAGGIAHDFNNILSAIMGYTDLSLYSETIDPNIRRNLEQIQNAGKRARDLVNQILSFSKIDELQEVATDIGSVVREVTKLLRAAIASSITITEEIPDGLPRVVVDPGRMHQVLMNLCTNAAQAVPAHGGEIVIRCERIEKDLYPDELAGLEDNDCLCITVEDNGCGIEQSLLPRIFDPYFTTKEKGEGTGLGLAIVHGIVTRSCGFITAASEPGKGCAFRIYFPFDSSERDSSDYVYEQDMPCGHEQILFVDDEVTLGEVAGEMLTRLGYRVEVKNSSVEALKSIRENPQKYDLLITDQTMPLISGVELTREVLELNPDLPVILYSGYSTAIAGDEAKRIGIRKFLMKPISMTKMATAIRQVFDES